MSFLQPQHAGDHRFRRTLARATLGWAALLVIAHLLDHQALVLLWVTDDAARSAMESKDWYRLLRVMGTLFTWLIVCPTLLLAPTPDRGSARRDHAGLHALLPLIAAAVAGAAAELLKLVIRRGRPDDFLGDYGWIAWSDGILSSSRLGMPSSHAAVAFGAAFAFMRLYPRTAWILLPAAFGCALTRVASGQHFLSDVVGGAAVGWLVAFLAVPAPHRTR